MMMGEFGTVAEAISEHATARSDQTALIMESERYDYGALNQKMDRVASSFQRDGLRVGDVIGICASSSLTYLWTFLGALRAGIAVAPLPNYSAADSLAKMIVDSGAKLLFVDAESARSLEPVRSNISATFISLDESIGRPYSDWLLGEGEQPQRVRVEPADIFNIIYSSGTTGVPKGVAQPFSMRWAQAKRASGMFDQSSILLLSTPLYSNLTLSPLFQAMSFGITVLIMKKFDPVGFLRLAQEHRVTHAMMVPNQYYRILSVPDFDSFDLSAFKTAYCAAAPFPVPLKSEVTRRFPGTLVELYGMTEGGGVTMLVPSERPDKMSTVGRPLEGHDLRIINQEGRELPIGEIGEVVGRSADMMMGYWKLPEATAGAEWFDDQGRRFIRTGDIGRFDDEGFLTLLDRRKDVIISGGLNIYGSDLEAALLAHSEVAEVAVVGVPSERWGETPVGFVVLKGLSSVSAEELRQFANQRLGRMQRLSAVECLESLPRNPLGKVIKRVLRERWTQAS